MAPLGLKDRHGTEIRLDIGTRRSELIVMLVVALAELSALAITTVVNSMSWRNQSWVGMTIFGVVMYVVMVVMVDEPGYLYTEIIRTLQARDVTARWVRRAGRVVSGPGGRGQRSSGDDESSFASCWKPPRSSAAEA